MRKLFRYLMLKANKGASAANKPAVPAHELALRQAVGRRRDEKGKEVGKVAGTYALPVSAARAVAAPAAPTPAAPTPAVRALVAAERGVARQAAAPGVGTIGHSRPQASSSASEGKRRKERKAKAKLKLGSVGADVPRGQGKPSFKHQLAELGIGARAAYAAGTRRSAEAASLERAGRVNGNAGHQLADIRAVARAERKKQRVTRLKQAAGASDSSLTNMHKGL